MKRQMTLRNWTVALLCLLCFFGAVSKLNAQTSAQSSYEPVELSTQSGHRRVIQPGGRIVVYGPENVRPVGGRLLSGGDSIVVGFKRMAFVTKVPASEVSAIRRYRIGWLAAAGYVGYNLLFLLIAIAFFATVSTTTGIGGFIILSAIPSLIIYGSLFALFMWLGARKYNTRRWQIVNR